ncbi:uncharacterized protein LOC124638233 isoform X1 [Helicoverpa zea]|uniref:uncharacterized protein LOC124638233 isoform X1 n=2 Tax=Helicoverpa zea TaxID=7113 RepID=UPI001F57C6F2|nr:uncharacterized protein LOC124638233 isoform X1 [Helicoverpa zea]
MNNKEKSGKSATVGSNDCSMENISAKVKGKNRGKKRKRRNSGSSEPEDVLPDNSAEVDRNLHASAIKNNLDETSVRKIIKKVVTNDRVLALVKMREEEDSGPDEDSLRPKLTRAKVKELMKVSPKTTAWNLEKLELTPINHIPVKTRPEVKALIAQELPEDEDDDEYEPTHDDVPSDDDQGLESCSDLDSQPRTPATPHSQHSVSPKVVKDGPFKVPQDIATPARRKLDLEEEATIALRTRSKLSLSSTSIEHIESTFVPPDDIPMPDVDDLWNEFLNECLNPASTSKNEDDDEADPEYNVAADPDAHDEDEEALGNSIIKISKKELNDLVTELFNIMPEAAADEAEADSLANSVLTDNSRQEVSTHWEGKQEVLSDEENGPRTTQKLSDRITFEKTNYSRVSVGKSEPQESDTPVTREGKTVDKPQKIAPKKSSVVKVFVEEQEAPTPASLDGAPPLIQKHVKPAQNSTEYVLIEVQDAACVLPEQVLLLQQQLRQHVQLATGCFLQLCVHPVHWSFAHKYKEYIETFCKIVADNPQSVANVCNLQPAMELITTWQDTVSADTPENQAMIQFIQKETDRCNRRYVHKNLYVGEFHETFLKVVANSAVFLYPYLLPAMPFRGDHPRRFCYLYSEDQLIALGMDEFWRYVNDNADIFKPNNGSAHWGLTLTMQLVTKHMFPWMPPSVLHSHVQKVRKHGDKDNPINKYLETRSVPPLKHKLLPFNPRMTLYEQPEHEVPRIWLRYLAKTSKRFRSYLMKRTQKTGVPAEGVDIEFGQAVTAPTKPPLPIDIIKRRTQPNADKLDIQLATTTQANNNAYKLVETSTGAYLVPFTMTVDSNTAPITTSTEIPKTKDKPETTKTIEKIYDPHCTCCVLLRKICTKGQKLISDYFSEKKEVMCFCAVKRYPKVSNRLKLLVSNYKNSYMSSLEALQSKIKILKNNKKNVRLNSISQSDTSISELEDIAFVTKFHLKLLARTSTRTCNTIKNKILVLLSNFNPYEHDPLKLATQLEKELGHRCIDLYKEFLCLLNPEQADKLEVFRDYFIRNCMADLVLKVEEQVPKEKRLPILEALHKVYSKNLATACEICTDILSALQDYPNLARHVHSLFPHRVETRSERTPASAQDPPQPTEIPSELSLCNNTTVMPLSDTVTDYEADQSMSEDEEMIENNAEALVPEPEPNIEEDAPIKTENISIEYTTPTSENNNISMVITVSKSEVNDFSESSNSSLRIMFEDEIVKIETPEWKRDEDKLILEVLKEHLSPEERQDKTILETIYDKNIVGMIADSLTDKSKEDIETRVMYLLQIC